MDRVVRWINLVPTFIAIIALFAMMAMTFFDVLFRSALNQPIEAATELTRILMAVMVFAVLPAVSASGKHICVDLLDPWFTGRARQWRDSLVDLVCGVVLIWPAFRCYDLALRAKDYGDVTEYLNIPVHYLTTFIAAFVLLAAIALIMRALSPLYFRSTNAAAPNPDGDPHG